MVGPGAIQEGCKNEAISLANRDIFKNSFESYRAPRIKMELLKKRIRVRPARVPYLPVYTADVP
ncbi:hypothetical protein CJ263_02585 [Maribacter cobaltidurans]|uniref:Uncharacterized protein n=1 Tax=Maribacter cobaltidurans TaxID=1178778 RepID=A0A223V2X3_9FLAO|nr:hypothetical protein CJ263_02585 [Maribacter cobaltidurans]